MGLGDTGIVKKVLIVRGGWPGHQPIETSNIFLAFLEANGFEIRIAESTSIYTDVEYMSHVDLIIQVITFGDLQESEAEGLIAAVTNGAGFIGWHGGVLASFATSEKYQHMIGAKFVSHPGKIEAERVGDATDWFVNHRYNFTEAGKSHEITKGISDFDLLTEQYWLLHDPYMEILATTTQAVRPGDPWHKAVRSPAIWTRLWGEGRIFVITAGHDVEIVQNENVKKIIEQGILWATR